MNMDVFTAIGAVLSFLFVVGGTVYHFVTITDIMAHVSDIKELLTDKEKEEPK